MNVRRGKRNKFRCIPLNAETCAVIRDHLRVRPATQVLYLLVGQRGELLSAYAIYDGVKYGRLAVLDHITPYTSKASETDLAAVVAQLEAD